MSNPETTTDQQIFLLAAEGKERLIIELLRDMKPAQLRDLRQAVHSLDASLDTIALERHQIKHQRRDAR